MEVPADTPLRILILAAEVAPLAKTGEVAEVIAPLAKALKTLGHDVRIAMPRYSHISPERFPLELLIESFAVPLDRRHVLATVYQMDLDGLPLYLIDNPGYFGQPSAPCYLDEAEPFIFYARAALEMLKRPELAWHPEVLHCHDWQTAIIPNWLATLYKDDPFFAQTATVLTIHRLSHQGIFGYRVLEVAGIAEHGFIHHAGLSDLAELVDLLGRGIYYADAITTVSERYAQEIQTPEFGEKLDPILQERSRRLYGVLNGIDVESFNPATDEQIPAPYDAATLEHRSLNKAALQNAMGLAQDADVPLIGMVSRLNDLKGFDLLTAILEPLMQNLHLQFAILGVGDPKYHEQLSELHKRFPKRIGVRFTFNETLERQIYAGSDMFLVPSAVEPCGLRHMIAMRYGSVPIVRTTGGLADTVENYNPRVRSGSGFSFEPYDSLALYTAIVRAVEIYHHRDIWRLLQERCMARDFSWGSSAAKYVDIYREALRHRLEEKKS